MLQGQFSQIELVTLAFLAFFEVMVVLAATRVLAETWQRLRGGDRPQVRQVIGLVMVGLILRFAFLMGAQFDFGPFVRALQVALAVLTLVVALGLRRLGRTLAEWSLMPALGGGVMLVLGLALLGKALGAGTLGEEWPPALALTAIGAILLVTRLRALMGGGPEPMPDNAPGGNASEAIPAHKDEDPL